MYLDLSDTANNDDDIFVLRKGGKELFVIFHSE